MMKGSSFAARNTAFPALRFPFSDLEGIETSMFNMEIRGESKRKAGK